MLNEIVVVVVVVTDQNGFELWRISGMRDIATRHDSFNSQHNMFGLVRNKAAAIVYK